MMHSSATAAPAVKKMKKRFGVRHFQNAAAISLTVVAPLERAALLLLVQDVSTTIAKENRYKGMIDVLKRVPTEQGVAALWRGNLTNVLRCLAGHTINFTFYNFYTKKFINGLDPKKDRLKYSLGHIAAGGAAGASSLCFVYPLDFARTRLTADVGKAGNREFKGLVDYLAKTLMAEGPDGVYRGFSAAVGRVVCYRAATIGMFDTLKTVFIKDREKLNFFANFGIAMSGSKKMLYKGTFDCLTKIVKDEGVRALYKGSLAHVFRQVGGALVLAIYFEIQQANIFLSAVGYVYK